MMIDWEVLQGRAERWRREARHRDIPEVFPPDDLPRPSRPKAGLGLVMIMMIMIFWALMIIIDYDDNVRVDDDDLDNGGDMKYLIHR